MAKKGLAYNTPRKVFNIPADMKPLLNYANTLVDSMRRDCLRRNNTTAQQAASERNAVKNSFIRKGKTNRQIKK